MKLNKKTVLSFFMIAMFLGSTLISISDMLWGGRKNMDTIVVMVTSLGTIEIKLAIEAAPITTENFLGYVESDYYDETVFHRVVSGFMIQGGGFIATGKQKITGDPIVLESNKGLLNKRGTIAMARTTDPDSATSQFFINLVDNDFLDYTSTNDGYAVFGEVVEGMDVVDAIGNVETATFGLFEDWPAEDVVILGAYVKEN